MKREWAKGTVKRVRGVHCVRLDFETHEIAKNLAEKYQITIKNVVERALMENNWEN